MSGRLFAVLAWAVWALTAAAIGTSIVLVTSAHALALDNVAMAIAFNAFPFVGAIIVSRRVRNPIGWICLAIGLGTALTYFDAADLIFVEHTYGHLTGAAIWLDWVGNMVWPLNLGLAGGLMLLFPTGRPPMPRWRWLVWALVVDTMLNIASFAVLPGAFSGETITNPAGIPGWQRVLEPLNLVTNLASGIIILLAAATVVWRFWRSRGVEREQMKWFAYGVGVLVVCTAITAVFLSDNNNLVFALGVVTLPIGIGVAVLRYRLYDIDVIIRRTLIYGALTAILAAVYFAVVLLAQVVGERLTGQAEPPAWLIVVTTLLIAALFTPLRRRVQRVIDRRFYRSRYDAARTIEGFAATLRTELDLSELRAQLVGVVEETMRPEHLTLWVRTPPSGDTGRA